VAVPDVAAAYAPLAIATDNNGTHARTPTYLLTASQRLCRFILFPLDA